MNIVLAGGTGFIGKAVRETLIARGDSLTLLTRDASAAGTDWGLMKALLWDGKTSGDWAKAVDGADAVINLSGESVANGRWTAQRKLVLTKSRLDSTRALVAAIAAAKKRPKTFLSASAVGYYGAAPDGVMTETSPQGSDFLAALCGQWEREAYAAEKLGVRTATLRLGVVLGEDGGALSKMALPFRLFVGGPLGSGRQPLPWIHRDDVVGAVLFLLDHEKVFGPVNLVAPQALTNAGFSSALGHALHRPSWATAPAVLIRLALGEMAEMILGGQRAEPQRLLGAGYTFKHPTADAALTDILG